MPKKVIFRKNVCLSVFMTVFDMIIKVFKILFCLKVLFYKYKNLNDFGIIVFFILLFETDAVFTFLLGWQERKSR